VQHPERSDAPAEFPPAHSFFRNSGCGLAASVAQDAFENFSSKGDELISSQAAYKPE